MADEAASFVEADESEAVQQDSWEDVSAQEESQSFWTWLRDRVFAPPRIPRGRVEALTGAILRNPQSASNYVLRGELWLQIGRIDEARTDFEQALEIASRHFEEDDWGLLAQAVRDRAEMGLEQVQRKVERQQKVR